MHSSQSQKPKSASSRSAARRTLSTPERILTQLRRGGYQISPDYQNADLVVVNTCGFIESAVQESLDAIGETLKENGKVIVTGCLGVRKNRSQAHPSVLKITGRTPTKKSWRRSMASCRRARPPIWTWCRRKAQAPPRHYAYPKFPGCNHRCTFCIIPPCAAIWVSRPCRFRHGRSRKPGQGRRPGAAGDFGIPRPTAWT